MPRYFFDVLNGGTLHRDLGGIDLPNIHRVWQIALTMVDDIAGSEHHLQPPDSVSVIVRDGSDVVVYRTDQLRRMRVPQPGDDPIEPERVTSTSTTEERAAESTLQTSLPPPAGSEPARLFGRLGETTTSSGVTQSLSPLDAPDRA